MYYRVLRNLRRVEARLEVLLEEQVIDSQDVESIRAFRLYLEQLDPELFQEVQPLVDEITEAVELGLSGEPGDYDKALVLLEATAIVNELEPPDPSDGNAA